MQLRDRMRRRTSKGVDLALLDDGSFIGEMRAIVFPVTGNGAVQVAPGWYFCNGAVLSRTDFKRLFDEIGTAYNIGGEAGTDFRLPDFRGRSPLPHAAGATGADRVIGAIAGNATAAGQVGGADAVVLVKANLPVHAHGKGTLSVSGGSHTHTSQYYVSADLSGASTNHGRLARGPGGASPFTSFFGGSPGNAVHTHPNANFGGATENGTADGLADSAHPNQPPHLPATGMVIRA